MLNLAPLRTCCPRVESILSKSKILLVKDIEKLDSVQGFPLKVCLKSWDGPYSDYLQACNLPHLVDRRKMLCLMYLYKAVNGYVVNSNGATIEPYI